MESKLGRDMLIMYRLFRKAWSMLDDSVAEVAKITHKHVKLAGGTLALDADALWSKRTLALYGFLAPGVVLRQAIPLEAQTETRSLPSGQGLHVLDVEIEEIGAERHCREAKGIEIKFWRRGSAIVGNLLVLIVFINGWGLVSFAEGVLGEGVTHGLAER